MRHFHGVPSARVLRKRLSEVLAAPARPARRAQLIWQLLRYTRRGTRLHDELAAHMSRAWGRSAKTKRG